MKSVFFASHRTKAVAGAVGLAVVVSVAPACARPLNEKGAVPVAPAPVAESKLVASLSQSGQITIRQADGDTQLLTIAPRLFEKGWQNRSIGTSGKGFVSENGATVTSGTLAAPSAGAQIAVRSVVKVEGRTVSVTSTLTPDKDIPVESVFIGLTAPVSPYLGAPFTMGATRGTVPQTVKDNHLASGTGSLQLGTGDKAFTVKSASGLLLQDNRTFNSSELEMRAGSLTAGTMKAGQPQTFTVTIELPAPVTLEKEEPLTITAGADWVPLTDIRDIVPGSALDFSTMFPGKPVEQTGWIVVGPDGHFRFEKGDGKPVRFYGVNLAFSANYLSHAEADRFADRMQRLGFNTVRVHHYEGDLIDQSRPDSLTFKPDALDKLDYLLAACKKRGIYVKTDMFVSRPVKASEMGVEAGADNFKAAILVSPPAMENWKEFSRRLLTHVNPYTKTAWKDDPTLSFISVVNEPNATNYLSGMSGKLAELFEAEWAGWLKAKNQPTRPLPRKVDSTPEGREVGVFLADLHRRAYAQMKTFLRNDIKTRALLTDNNGWSEFPALMLARTELDWVDNHFYWDHPRFLEKDWQLPSGGYSEGRSALSAGGAGPNSNSMTRLYGKPFTLSEYDYPAPNRYRAEGGLLTGYAAALQDWDGLWKFAYSHSEAGVVSNQPTDYFNAGNDPINLASDRLAVLLFRRGDAKPAPDALVRVLPEAALKSDTTPLPPGFADLTLVARVGTLVTQGERTDVPGQLVVAGGDAEALAALKQYGKLPAGNQTDVTKGVRQSETNELVVISTPETLKLATPRTVAVVASPSAGLVTVGPLSIQASRARATVYVTSLDGKPVSDSGHLLVCHLTDVQNSGARFSSPDRKVLEAWGTLPHLAQRGQANATLTTRKTGTVQAWRLDPSGKRVAPFTATLKDGRLGLPLDTLSPGGEATLYYEVEVR